MAEYDSSIDLAERLIKKKGQLVSIRQTTLSAPPDDTQPWKTGAASTNDTDVYGVFLEYSKRDIDGEKIKQGDQRVYVPAKDLSIIPQPDDMLIRDTEIWHIQAVNELNPGGQLVMYDLQVRR